MATPVGWVVSWLLNLFGVGIVAAMTGGLVGFVIDFLLKEGQGMGAAGFSDHVVVCGWNATARDLLDELKSDDYGANIVLIDSSERNPAGEGVYFIRGDGANDDDLRRAGIMTAKPPSSVLEMDLMMPTCTRFSRSLPSKAWPLT